MALDTTKENSLLATGTDGWQRYLPVLNWARRYRRDELADDLVAGLIVAIMLVPQSMAYALLAGLPPQVGLYASILPLILYGLLGTSRALAVGPVAIVSLLVATGVGPLAEPGSPQYVQLALTLALMVGLIQTLMGMVRVGFLVNFLSHPVLAGFTSAAAFVIGFSQLKHLLGVPLPREGAFYEQVWAAARRLGETNAVALLLGAAAIVLLLYFKYGLARHLRRLGVREGWITPLAKSAPLVVVIVGTLFVWALGLHEVAGVAVVGDVPAGLPPVTRPTIDLAVWRRLLPAALAISFVGYMESISVAKSLASKRRQRVEANQELIALGVANLGATLTGGYPVTGGFSRSVVNFSAGASSGLASIITALLIALTVLFLTPLFTFLPRTVLAAIIVVAVAGLVDVHTLRRAWRYNKADAASLLATFFAVLVVGVERGILVGVAVALLLFIWRTSRPHVAVVGRLGESDVYRNVLRHAVQTCEKVVAIRVDESLYFANTKYLEETVLNAVAARPAVEHFLLIGAAINFIDASALETLESLIHELRDAGVSFHLAEMKGPVMDRLQAVDFVAALGADHIHLTTHTAMKALGCVDR